MGYMVSSLLTVGVDDPHRSFIYYLPTDRFAHQWVNDWIYDRFQKVAGRLGPNAVLIAPHDRDNLQESFGEALDWESEDDFLHAGLPFLVVSRRPVRPSGDGEPTPFAAINLASLDEAKLGELFDVLVEAASKDGDLLDSIPTLGAKLANDDSDDRHYFSQAIELKPHIFGIGLNGNLLLDFFSRRRDRRLREKTIVQTDGGEP